MEVMEEMRIGMIGWYIYIYIHTGEMIGFD